MVTLPPTFLITLDKSVKVPLTFWESIETKEAFVSIVDSSPTFWVSYSIILVLVYFCPPTFSMGNKKIVVVVF